jgi:DNA-binding transcriptional MocR family regulator
VEPKGGCVGFPRFNPDINIDIDNFYRILNENYKAYVAPGHWFEMDRRFMRIGYAWPDKQEVSGGLQAISAAIKKTVL